MSMTKIEINDFLAAPRVARLATTRPNGGPHIVPVWYSMMGRIFLSVTTKTLKAKNIEKNPNVALVIDDILGKAGDISFFTDRVCSHRGHGRGKKRH